jgi:hypothetical protein
MKPLEGLPRGLPERSPHGKLPQSPQTANDFARIPQRPGPRVSEESKVTVMTPLPTTTSEHGRTEPASRSWSYSNQKGWGAVNDPLGGDVTADSLSAAGYIAPPQLVLGSESTYWKAEVYARFGSPQEMVVIRTPDTTHKVVTSNLVSLLQVLALVKDFCEAERPKPSARKRQ